MFESTLDHSSRTARPPAAERRAGPDDAVSGAGHATTGAGRAAPGSDELMRALAELGIEAHPLPEPDLLDPPQSGILSASPEARALIETARAEGDDGGYAAAEHARRLALSRHAAWFARAVTEAEDDLDAQVEDLLDELRDRVASTDVDADVTDLETDEIVPGPQLASILAGTELEGLDNYSLTDVAASWQRMVSWATAGLARSAAALAERRAMNPRWPVSAGHVRVTKVAGDELTMRLGCSRRMGKDLVRTGLLLAGPLAETGRQLSRGRIDTERVAIIVRALADSPVQTTVEVESQVLPGAKHRTPSQLERDVRRALIAVDPSEAADRERRAEASRRVNRPSPQPDGMAGIWALLPAPTAVRIDADLYARARTLRAAGDPRTLDQLRADLFAQTLLWDELQDAPDPARSGTATAAPEQSRGREHDSTPRLGRGAGLGTGLDLGRARRSRAARSPEPASRRSSAPGSGSVPAPRTSDDSLPELEFLSERPAHARRRLRRPARTARGTRRGPGARRVATRSRGAETVVTAPRNEPADHGDTSSPADGRPLLGTALPADDHPHPGTALPADDHPHPGTAPPADDHPHPGTALPADGHPLPGTALPPDGRPPAGTGSATDTGPATDTSPATDTVPTPRRRLRERTSRTVINVTVPLSTLLGVDDGPGELAGYGPISADVARKLAAEGTWRRIVTDPLSGAVLDLGRTRYRPPADLDAHVRERDRVCARPGCSSPATSCELDHTIEYWRSDGTTAHTNLGPLCKRDHQIKTDGGFTVVQPVPGVFVWRTPTGQVYVVRPGADGLWTRVPRSALTGLTEPGTDPAKVGAAVARLAAAGRRAVISAFEGESVLEDSPSEHAPPF